MSRHTFNPARGRVKRTVLFHALEEGVVTASTLHMLTGLDVIALRDGLERMRKNGLVQWAKKDVSPATGRRFSGHALTPVGIEAALQIEKSDVMFAAAEAETEGAHA